MSLPASASRPARETAFAAAFFLAVTVVMTWPQAARLSDGMTDLWDAKLNLRILDWNFHQTFRNPFELFQLNFFHPARYVLAFSENLYGVALFGFPLFALGASPVVVYNVLLLLGMFLSAFSAWALARYVTGDALASLAAGFVYAFLPWRLSQLPHLQHQWGAFLCLLLLFLLRYLDSGGRRDLVLFGVFFAWNALCNVHFALFSGFVVAVTLVLWAMERSPERSRRLRGAVLAAVVGGAAFVPFAIPYRRASELYGMRRYFSEMMTFSGRWGDFLSAGEKNRLYGTLTSSWRHAEGDFFPGLVAVALAIYAVARLWRHAQGLPEEARESPARRRAARLVDVLLLAAVAAWLGSLLRSGLRLGPLHLGDPSRVQVIVTMLALARLALAFPRGSRYASLGDLLRRGPLPPRSVLFLAIGATGLLIALGGNAPYYRLLFQSFGRIFGVLRAPSRGIVLFDLALAILAAWGLSLGLRRCAVRGRAAWTGVLLGALVVEYRAFPLEIHSVEPEAPAVYRWLARLDLPGAVVEWPLGPNDTEYLFRQTAHGKPLVNGYSGFFPKPYDQLQASLTARPIPDGVWKQMADLGACLVIYHPRSADSIRQLELSRLIHRGLREGRIETLGGFPNGEGRDIAFRLTSAPPFDARLPAGSEGGAAGMLSENEAEIAPPFGAIEFPATVAPAQWQGGWALDDSGILEVRIASELGPAGSALLGMHMPGLAQAYPDYANSDRGGFGFPIPDLPPGRHTLLITLVAKDGGQTILTRSVEIRPAVLRSLAPAQTRTPTR